MYPVQHYFLEDCIQLCNYCPPVEQRKRKAGRDSGDKEDDDEKPSKNEDGEDLNNQPLGPEYTDQTKKAMSTISEKDVRTNVSFAKAINSSIFNYDLMIFLRLYRSASNWSKPC